MLLVTGSSGQIGSYVVDLARARGLDVRGLDLRPSRWTDEIGDIRDPADCTRAMAGRRAVVHCAARVSVPMSMTDPVGDAETNVLGTLHLLQAASRAGVKRFVNVSSAAVYGEPAELPLRERSPTLPLSPYGASKLAAEGYARLARAQGLETVSVRPFNVYSVRQDPSSPYSGVLSLFAKGAREGRAPRVLGDGSQTRDFVHAQDVAGWMLDLATGPLPPQTVNLGTGRAVSILEVARLFMAGAGLQGSPEFGPARAGDILHSVADVSVARGLGLHAGRPLQDGLRELIPAPAAAAQDGRPAAR